MRKGYIVPAQFTLNKTTSSVSLAGAFFFNVKNDVTGTAVDVEIEGCGTFTTLQPGAEFKFDTSSPEFPFRDNAQLKIGFFSGDSIVTVTIFYVKYE